MTQLSTIPAIDNNDSSLATLESIEETCSFTMDEQVLEDWFMDKSKLTEKNYRNTYCQFQELLVQSQGLQADKPLRAVTKSDIRLYQIWCENRGNKPKTITHKVYVLKSLFKHLIAENYRTHNPAENLKASQINKDDKTAQTKDVRQRVIPHTDIKRIIAGANNRRDRVLFELIYRLGLRMHECLNLSWGDFYYDGHSRRVSIVGKGGKQRINKVPEDLYKKLLSLGTENYLFLSNRGKKLSLRMCDKAFKQAVNRAGLSSDISCHDLRHSFASHSLTNGASLMAVRDQLGHSSISITSQYLHSDESASDFIDL